MDDHSHPGSWVAVLGRREIPVDGVEDYCSFLGEALERHGIRLHSVRVEWAREGWIQALRRLWRESATWTDGWVLLQYTAMAWSRRGFPFGALAAATILRRRHLRCAVIFHEHSRHSGGRLIDRLRGKCQEWVIRSLYDRAAKAIFPYPLNKVHWLPDGPAKAAFIPIGANIPAIAPEGTRVREQNGSIKIVAVFCLSDAPNRERELGDIAHATSRAARDGTQLKILFLGRGTAEAKDEIEKLFQPIGAEVVNLGLRTAPEVGVALSESNVMICVRGPVFPTRGSAIAGIACGLPIVGYAGAAEGTPLEEAGVVLVPYRDREALAQALALVLKDQEMLLELRRRSLSAQQRYFSWDVIASKMLNVFGQDQGRE